MNQVIVEVKSRKKRTDYKASNGGVFEKVKKERQARNKKMLAEYNREIRKVINTR
ncbi:hypothetical protein [Bacillus mobilis]|uniref:hypothetical protein n=1 Tax=Bacillus mobilis TaxID=2026190 RepID=UPI002E2409C8|nr:hypothetical protein [Bacillus mobilis]MED0956315.1 hypothetical protein [Bacillus mobilis]